MLVCGQGRGSLQPLAVATTALIVASLFVMGGSEVPPTTRQAGVSPKDAGAVIVKDINLANQIIGEIGSLCIQGFLYRYCLTSSLDAHHGNCWLRSCNFQHMRYAPRCSGEQ